MEKPQKKTVSRKEEEKEKIAYRSIVLLFLALAPLHLLVSLLFGFHTITPLFTGLQ